MLDTVISEPSLPVVPHMALSVLGKEEGLEQGDGVQWQQLSELEGWVQERNTPFNTQCLQVCEFPSALSFVLLSNQRAVLLFEKSTWIFKFYIKKLFFWGSWLAQRSMPLLIQGHEYEPHVCCREYFKKI